MTRSAFDDFAETMHPLPSKLPAQRRVTVDAKCSLTPTELFAFITRSMTLRGSLVFWKRDGGRDLVPQRYGDDLEDLLSFKAKGEVQLVRYAEVAWMLRHNRSIPDGHAVRYSDGNVFNRDPCNLWLVKTTAR